jgi:hypothetical protein
MNTNFTVYNKSHDESIYQTLAKICGKGLVDFEEIEPDNYFVVKSDSLGSYCLRISFKNSQIRKQGKKVMDADGDWEYEERIENVAGYYLFHEYSDKMGRNTISERLFSKLTDYTYNSLEKREYSSMWRKTMAAAISAKKRVKLRTGDIIRIEPAIRIGSEKRGEKVAMASELKCISINPLRFSNVVIRGVMEEYDGSYYVPRIEIARRKFEYLERGKPSRKQSVSKFNEAEHLKLIAEAVEKYGDEIPKPLRKKRDKPIGIDMREFKPKMKKSTSFSDMIAATKEKQNNTYNEWLSQRSYQENDDNV